MWELRSSGSILKTSYSGIIVTKSIRSGSLKQGNDARITISVFNSGTTTVHDVEILDTDLPEFPVLIRQKQYSVPLIEPNGTGILAYMVHSTKAGSLRLNKSAVVHTDQEGNYQITYSNYEKVVVLPPPDFSSSSKRGR